MWDFLRLLQRDSGLKCRDDGCSRTAVSKVWPAVQLCQLCQWCVQKHRDPLTFSVIRFGIQFYSCVYEIYVDIYCRTIPNGSNWISIRISVFRLSFSYTTCNLNTKDPECFLITDSSSSDFSSSVILIYHSSTVTTAQKTNGCFLQGLFDFHADALTTNRVRKNKMMHLLDKVQK